MERRSAIEGAPATAPGRADDQATWALPPGEAGEWDSSDDEESPAAKKRAAVTGDDPPSAPVPVDGFVPSATFDGARYGWVFKRGEAGVGYYPDSASAKMEGLAAQLDSSLELDAGAVASA